MSSVKRLPKILEAMQTAQSPSSFTTRFLDKLGFKVKGDRLIIGVLKDIGFLDDKGTPKERYFRFLDQTNSAIVLAEGIREAWKDLFEINVNANQLQKAEFVGKLKTLSEGRMSDKVMEFHFMTFSALVKNADFKRHLSKQGNDDDKAKKSEVKIPKDRREKSSESLQLGGLVYNIQIVLPESRDPAVYDALFRSLRDHLL